MRSDERGKRRRGRDSEVPGKVALHIGGFHAVQAALEAVSGSAGSGGSGAANKARSMVERVDEILVETARTRGGRGERAGTSGSKPGGARRRRAEGILEAAEKAGVPVRTAEDGECDRLTGVRSQGVAAAIRYRYGEFSEVLAAGNGVLVFLDGVEDPHNLGAVIRSAAAVGADGVVIPRHRAASVTPAVVRASAGTAVVVPVCRVTNLVPAIQQAREAGCWVTGLDASGGSLLKPGGPEGRSALVVGGEGRGLRELVARNCDEIARLPMAEGVESLNASAAAAVALYRLCEARLFQGPRRVDTLQKR